MNVVLDTNVLIMSISKGSPFHSVWTEFLSGRYTICYTTEILLEYEEVLARKVSSAFANAVLTAIVGAINTIEVEDYYKMQLITADPDDNKFVDCAFAANAHYIVSEDHHYDLLRNIDYPRIEVIDIDNFVKILQKLPFGRICPPPAGI